MVPDPYKALELLHGASAKEIKDSYRKLALRYHPDRLVARGASESEKAFADGRFSAISAAYQLLSDPVRKSQYDHVYKYGGYDEPTPVAAAEKNNQPADFDASGSPRQRNV